MAEFWRISIPGRGNFDIEVSPTLIDKLDQFCRHREITTAEALDKFLNCIETFCEHTTNPTFGNPIVAIVELAVAQQVQVSNVPNENPIQCCQCGGVAYASQPVAPWIQWRCGDCPENEDTERMKRDATSRFGKRQIN